MSQLLPPALIALSATALVAVLFALWVSVRSLLSAGTGARVASRSLPERERLLAEKKTLLSAIKDLEFERDVGKLSQDDFERLDARYRASARGVLQALEGQLEPHRGRARSLIEKRIEGLPGEASEPASARGGASGSTVAASAAATREPHACGTQNEPDAVFCKKCGERLVEEAGE